VLIARLLHDLPQVVLHEHRRSCHFPHLYHSVKVVNTVDRHLLSQVLQLSLDEEALFSTLLTNAPTLLNDSSCEDSLSEALLVEFLDATCSVQGHPLLHSRVKGRAHELQVTLIHLVSQFLGLDPPQVYVRAQENLIR